jgi:hypothetical protein
MVLLVFIAALVVERGMRIRPGRSMLDRTVRLAVPAALWWTGYVMRARAGLAAAVSPYLRQVVETPISFLWFLPVLLIASVTCGALIRAFGKYAWIALLAAAVATQAITMPAAWGRVAPELGFLWQHFQVLLPVYALALIVAPRLLPRLAKLRALPWWVLVGVVIAAVATTLVWMRVFPGHTNILFVQAAQAGLSARDQIMSVVAAWCGLVASLCVAELVVRIPAAGRALAFVGQRTMDIFVVHWLVILPFAGLGLVWAPVASALAVAVSLAVSWVVRRSSVAAFVAYGDRSALRARS